MMRYSSSPWLRSNCKFAYPVRRSPSSLGRRRTRVSRSVATLPCHLDHKNKREATPLFCFYDEVLKFALVAKQLQVRIPRPKIAKLAWQAQDVDITERSDVTLSSRPYRVFITDLSYGHSLFFIKIFNVTSLMAKITQRHLWQNIP